MTDKVKNLDILEDHAYLVFDRTDNKVGFLEKDGRTLENDVSLFKNQNGSSKNTGGFVGNKNKRLTDTFDIKNVLIEFLNFPKNLGVFKAVDGVIEKVAVSGKLVDTNRKFVDDEIHQAMTETIAHLIGLSITRGQVIELETDAAAIKRLKAFELAWVGNTNIDFQLSMDSTLKHFNNESFKVAIGQSESYDGSSVKSTILFKYFETEQENIDNTLHDVVKIPIKLSLFGINRNK